MNKAKATYDDTWARAHTRISHEEQQCVLIVYGIKLTNYIMEHNKETIRSYTPAGHKILRMMHWIGKIWTWDTPQIFVKFGCFRFSVYIFSVEIFVVHKNELRKRKFKGNILSIENKKTSFGVFIANLHRCNVSIDCKKINCILLIFPHLLFGKQCISVQ